MPSFCMQVRSEANRPPPAPAAPPELAFALAVDELAVPVELLPELPHAASTTAAAAIAANTRSRRNRRRTVGRV
jgi:hypothetical protein